ncbi:hypothetical protein QEN19_000983 [Hanseniaspora menglaensis]
MNRTTMIDLFPILSVNEIFNILNKQLNYKMITVERLTKVNYTRDNDGVFLIDFYKNFIFDYQLSGIKEIEPLDSYDLNNYIKSNSDLTTNLKLLKFIQKFLPSLGISDFMMTDLFNCDLEGNNSKRLIRVMSCLINFIRFSQERLKEVSHLIDQINIENKLDVLQTKLSILETEDKDFLLNKLEQLELNNLKKNKELEDINNQKLASEIKHLKEDINIKKEELKIKSLQTEAFNDFINFFDSVIINNLLSNNINKKLISYKNILNEKNQDLKTVNELETFLSKNESLIKDLEEDNSLNILKENSIRDMNDEAFDSDEVLNALKLLYEFLAYENEVPLLLLRKINSLQNEKASTLDAYVPLWKNMIVKKQNILHILKIGLLTKLSNEIEKATTQYYQYKDDIILEYDQMNEEMNDYVQNIIEYI